MFIKEELLFASDAYALISPEIHVLAYVVKHRYMHTRLIKNIQISSLHGKNTINHGLNTRH